MSSSDWRSTLREGFRVCGVSRRRTCGVCEIAPVFLKDEGRIEALFTLYAIALLVQALIERELRQAMAREGIEELPIYPEQRQCAHLNRSPKRGRHEAR